MKKMFNQLDILRILNGADEANGVVNAILQSEPYKAIVDAQSELVDTVINILFDQTSVPAPLKEQLKLRFGQSIKSIVAFVLDKPLAMGADFPTEGFDVFGFLWDWLISFFKSDDVEILEAEVQKLKSEAAEFRKEYNIRRLQIWQLMENELEKSVRYVAFRSAYLILNKPI